MFGAMSRAFCNVKKLQLLSDFKRYNGINRIESGRGHNVRYDKKRKLLSGIITSCLALLLILPGPSAYATAEGEKAADKLHVQTEVGYNGTYLPGKSVPVTFTLSNNLNRDLKGELVLNIRDSSGVAAAHIMPLEITMGSTVEAVMTVDGSFSKLGSWIQFYEGGVDRGEQVEIDGTRYLEGKSISTPNVIGIAASDPDTLNFTAFFNNNGISTTPIVLGDDFYAGSIHDLSMFSIIALNDVAAGQWSEQKVKAIKDWVASGGTLLVGGGAGYSQTAAAFAELVPVEGQATVTWSRADLLSSYIGSPEPLAPLQIIDGKLVRGRIVLEDQGTPIVAVNDYGHGKVYYTAFDLGLKPFSNWDGRTEFLQSILGEQLMLQGAAYQANYNWPLENSASYFPRLKSPEVGGLLVIFAIYTLIVAPILYIVLRRLDRREWSWWLIPTMAVVSTVIIVIVGTRDKAELYMNGVKVAMIDDQVVKEVGARKVFIPNSKDVHIALPEHSYPRLSESSISNSAEVNTNKQQRIYYNGASREAVYTNNKYWTTKSVVLQEQIYNAEQYGTLSATLQDGSASLLIRNDTGVDVEHLSLAANNQLYYIGALAAGEEVSYSLPALTIITNQPKYYGGSYSSDLVTGSGMEWEQLARETALLDSGSYINDTAMLVAFSYDDTAKYVVNDKAVKSDELTAWVVNITDQLTDGLLQQDLVSPSNVIVEQGEYSQMDQAYFSLNQGEILFKYTIAASQSGTALSGQVQLDNYQNFTPSLRIFNEELGQWEDVPSGSFELEPYMNEFNMLQVKLDSGQNYFEGSFPVLLLDREVQ